MNTDTKVLEQEVIIDSQKDTIKTYRQTTRNLILLRVVMLLVAFGSIVTSVLLIQKTQSNSVSIIESNKMTLLNGLYSVTRTAEGETMSREKRIEVYFKRAKKIILNHNSKTDLTDRDINETLRMNFQLAEYYVVNPYMYLSYWAEESDFTKGKNNRSGSGAKGPVQFMTPTMKMVLGDSFVPGMEYDPVWSCRAWYKYVSTISPAVGGDFVWIACAYLSLDAIKFRNEGKKPEQFMKWLIEVYPKNDPKYPWKILDYYNKFVLED